MQMKWKIKWARATLSEEEVKEYLRFVLEEVKEKKRNFLILF